MKKWYDEEYEIEKETVSFHGTGLLNVYLRLRSGNR